MKKDLNQIFEELLNRYVSSMEQNYQTKYKRAKDKEFVKEELKRATDFMNDWISQASGKGEMFGVFSKMYKRGDDINEIIAHLRGVYGEVNDERSFKRIENGKRITLYISEEEKALKKLALDERKLLKYLIRAIGYVELQKRLPKMFDEKENVSPEKPNAYPIIWSGKKDNKNEFVQLIYGLHKAGLINEGKGEITKIIETLAENLKVDLGKGWQANHSSSIHRAKEDYQPRIFHKIQLAYGQYITEQLTLKKSKK